MTGIFWLKGKNYYQVRGWLLKHGFDKTSNYGFYDDAKTKGWQEFDNGVETITVKCTIKRGKNGNLQCDQVYDVKNVIYDSLNVNTDKKAIYENIMNTVAKEVKKAINKIYS